MFFYFEFVVTHLSIVECCLWTAVDLNDLFTMYHTFVDLSIINIQNILHSSLHISGKSLIFIMNKLCG